MATAEITGYRWSVCAGLYVDRTPPSDVGKHLWPQLWLACGQAHTNPEALSPLLQTKCYCKTSMNAQTVRVHIWLLWSWGLLWRPVMLMLPIELNRYSHECLIVHVLQELSCHEKWFSTSPLLRLAWTTSILVVSSFTVWPVSWLKTQQRFAAVAHSSFLSQLSVDRFVTSFSYVSLCLENIELIPDFASCPAAVSLACVITNSITESFICLFEKWEHISGVYYATYMVKDHQQSYSK